MSILVYALIYAGSAIMVYNIARYYSFIKKMREYSEREHTKFLIAAPESLLTLFLIGYLSVAIFGKPDIVVALILFGGSLFVFMVVQIIHRIIGSLVESNARASAQYQQAKQSLDDLTKDCLSVFRVNLSKDEILERSGSNLYDSDYSATSYTELLLERRNQLVSDYESAVNEGRFTRKNLLKAFSLGQTEVGEKVFCRLKNGETAFVHLQAMLVADPDTADVEAFITETLCNEEVVNETLLGKALKQQYAMIAYLVNGEYGIVIGDPDLSNSQSVFPTERRGDYLGYLADRIAPILDGSPVEQIETMSKLGPFRMRQELEKSEPYVVDLPLLIDGEKYYARLAFYVVDPTARFYLLLAQDTTEVRKLEIQRSKRLEAALREAEQASKAKTTFLADMSHDIRTPLNAIVGYTEIARKTDDPERIGEYLGKIDASSKYLLAMANDVLEMSRIETSGEQLELEPTDLVQLAQETKETYAGEAAAKNIEYKVETSLVTDKDVICDRTHVNHVLMNLLSNAFKFTPEGGHVSLVVVQGDTADGYADYGLRVKDDGIGMSPAFASKVFDAFEREYSTTESGVSGAGLGMAIAKNLVETMGGTIRVESTPGVGTEFIVRLRLRLADAPDEQPAVDEPIDFTGMRILLAEDNELNMEIATVILEELGFMVESVENGQLAVDLLTSKPAGYFDLVLTDIRMPVMDGLEEARTIRALPDPQLASIPIVAISANAFQEDVQAGYAAGMNGYLGKPIDVGDLIDALTAALAKR